MKLPKILHITLMKQDSFFKNVFKLAASSSILTFVPILVTPVLSRLYSPEDYAEWGVFSSVFYIINSFIFLSYENAIVKTNKKEELPILILLCTIICSSISILVYTAFVVGRFCGIRFFLEFPSERLLFVSLLSTAYYTILYSFANRQQSYSFMAVSNIINGTGQAAIRIMLGLIPVVTHGLIWGNVLAHIISFLFILFCLNKKLRELAWNSVNITNLKRAYYDNIKFLKYDAPARFIEFLVGNLSIIILAMFFSGREIGCFSMSVQLVLLPITMIGSAMGNVYYREISEKCNNKMHVRVSTLRVLKISFILSLIPIFLLSIGLDKFMPVLLGAKWADAGNVLLCLAIYSLPVILTEPLLPAYRALNCQEKRFYYNILNVIFALGGLLCSCLLFSNLYICLVVYATAFALVRLLLFRNLLKITNIKIDEVSIYFTVSIFCVYFLLTVRLIYSVIL